jgi:flavodoxin
MKTLIVYMSIHHQNTEKVASAMAEAVGADLKKPSEVTHELLTAYDLVGFGSGIYFSKFHKSMLDLVERLGNQHDKKAFVFNTSGAGRERFNDGYADMLSAKGFKVVGKFSCKGLDTWGPFKLIGGLAKGRPNQSDLINAQKFIKEL